MLEALACAWEASPDLRLGQLLENARAEMGGRVPMFSIEDDVLLRGIVLLEQRLAAPRAWFTAGIITIVRGTEPAFEVSKRRRRG